MIHDSFHIRLVAELIIDVKAINFHIKCLRYCPFRKDGSVTRASWPWQGFIDALVN